MNAIGFGTVSSAGFVAARRRDRQSRWQRWFQRVILTLGAGLALIGAAAAQDYPARQIVVIVPFPAGGSTDILARIISEPLRQALGQPVVVQNVPGAGSTIGVGRAIQSAPDGYTLIVGNWTSHVGAGAEIGRAHV